MEGKFIAAEQGGVLQDFGVGPQVRVGWRRAGLSDPKGGLIGPQKDFGLIPFWGKVIRS